MLKFNSIFDFVFAVFQLFCLTKSTVSVIINTVTYAGVVKLADTIDLGSIAFGVQVQVLSPVPAR